MAAELFATTLDAYLLLGELPEHRHGTETADGRPAEREYARERLARMVGADRTSFTLDDATVAAGAIRAAQKGLLDAALDRVLERLGTDPGAVVVAGSGEFLARSIIEKLGCRIVSLEEELGSAPSAAACAYALAALTREHWPELV